MLPSALSPGLWEQVTLRNAHPASAPLFCPSYVIPLATRAPTLLAHHGSYEGYPSAFSWWALNKARAIYAASVHRATVVTTVSEFSRKDIEKFYHFDAQRIHIVPEGVDTRTFRPLPGDQRVGDWRSQNVSTDRPFILYVGKPTERRNLSQLIRAFASLRRERSIDHKLVIAGADLPGTSPFRKVIEDESLIDDVVVIGYLTHDELPLAYNAADMLVYPSSYEGFGMPVLEAMACGTPAIALDNTAFPEFAGGVALLLSDARPTTLAQGMLAVLDNDGQRQQMRERGPVRAADYDWGIITRRYLDLLVTLT